MAKLVFGMNQSLDGYVDHTKFSPSLPRSSVTSLSRRAAWQVACTVAACTRSCGIGTKI
jgi:hypothetical protein